MAKVAEIFPVLQTPRLGLRRFEPRDLPGLHACLGDAEAMRYWNAPACKTPAETEKMLVIHSKITSPYSNLSWAICRKSDDACIGMVGYHHREARNRRLEFGYVVAPKHQRKGFGTEAVVAVLGYCVEKLSDNRVEALIHPENLGSIGIVKKLGFRCEGGPLKDYWYVGDTYVSVMMYAYIASVR